MGFSTRSAKITSANLGRTWSTHNLINLWIPDIGGLYYLICTVWGVIGVVTEHVSLSMQGDGMNWAPQNAPLTLTSRSLKVPNFSDYKLIKYVWHTSIIDWEENLQENAIFDDKYYGFWKKKHQKSVCAKKCWCMDSRLLTTAHLACWNLSGGLIEGS